MNGTKIRKPHKRKALNWQLALIIILSVIIVAVVFTGGFLLRSLLIKPQAGRSEYHTLYAGTETKSLESSEVEDSKPGSENSEPGVYKRRDNVYNFLLLGMDEVAGNTDVIIIASFDCNVGKISMVQIPRDTYAEFGGSYGKINTAYKVFRAAAVRAKSPDPTKEALKSLAEMFSNSLNVPIDFYAMITLEGFRAVVDRIGGVDMYVPYDMYYVDPEQNLYINIKKGQQTLMGKDAEGFVRYRSGYIMADLARGDAQKMFITAFISKVKSSISIQMISGLAKDILPNLVTNLQLSDCIYFAKAALGVDMSNITMMTMPGAGNSKGTLYIMQRKAMLNIVNNYLNVYDKSIPDSYFDVDRIFTDDPGTEIYNLYMSGDGSVVTYNADDIEKSGIKIGLK